MQKKGFRVCCKVDLQSIKKPGSHGLLGVCEEVKHG